MRYLIISLMLLDFLFGYTKIKILKIDNDTAKINKGNLIIGQSGAIIHKFKNGNEIILKYAYIIKSNNSFSIIKFSDIKILPQKALANTNLLPQKNDYFILNNLYHNSLIIAPNYQSYKEIKNIYKTFNFLNPDYFAAFLKLDRNPTPNKKDIQDFCIDNQIGTIFFVIKNKVYLVDIISFKVIFSKKIDITSKKIQLPFFSNVEDIKGNIFNWGKIGNYDKYYSKIIGLDK